MSAQPSYQNSKDEEYARWRRRDHANIEAMQNLVIARIARETGVEMPPNVRHLVSALQGAHGGGEAIRQRVRRWVDDLLAWQRAAGVELFSVVKGGDVIGTNPDGSPIRKTTVFVDNLKPRADEAVQRARTSELWRGNPQKGIRAHPGKALAAQVEWLRKELPVLKPEPEAEGVRKAPLKLPVGEYERRREEVIAKALEDTADEIEERDGDADLWLERIEKLVRRMRDSRRKTSPARRSWPLRPMTVVVILLIWVSRRKTAPARL